MSPNGHPPQSEVVHETRIHSQETIWPINKPNKDNSTILRNNANILRRASMNDKSNKTTLHKKEDKDEVRKSHLVLPDVLPMNAKLMAPRSQYVGRPNQLSLAPLDDFNSPKNSPKTPPSSPPKSPSRNSPFAPLRTTVFSASPMRTPSFSSPVRTSPQSSKSNGSPRNSLPGTPDGMSTPVRNGSSFNGILPNSPTKSSPVSHKRESPVRRNTPPQIKPSLSPSSLTKNEKYNSFSVSTSPDSLSTASIGIPISSNVTTSVSSKPTSVNTTNMSTSVVPMKSTSTSSKSTACMGVQASMSCTQNTAISSTGTSGNVDNKKFTRLSPSKSCQNLSNSSSPSEYNHHLSFDQLRNIEYSKSVEEQRILEQSRVIEQPRVIEGLQLIQRTEVVLRVNPCTIDAASQTEKEDLPPTPLPIRKKLQEEIECEKLSEELLNHLPTTDRLKGLLGKAYVCLRFLIDPNQKCDKL